MACVNEYRISHSTYHLYFVSQPYLRRRIPPVLAVKPYISSILTNADSLKFNNPTSNNRLKKAEFKTYYPSTPTVNKSCSIF